MDVEGNWILNMILCTVRVLARVLARLYCIDRLLNDIL